MAVSSRGKLPAFWLSLIGGFALVASLAVAETITLKNGVVYRGSVDKDNTIVSIFDTDGLKRVIIRDSKIASTTSDQGSARSVHFPIVQPITNKGHAGEMPKAAYGFQVSD